VQLGSKDWQVTTVQQVQLAHKDQQVTMVQLDSKDWQETTVQQG
jgi:hypothetical protein